MSGVIEEPQPGRRRRLGGIFDRWPVMVPGVLLVLTAIGLGAWLLSADSQGDVVVVEAADSLGADPFTTRGLTLVAQSNGASPGLYGGSGDNGVCAPEQLVAFLRSQPAKAGAWVAALNSDSTLRWSGGDSLDVGDIPAYVGELKPAFLTADTRVTNHGFKGGRATPRQSLLERGTAVLVDMDGAPRVRCICGNPLHPRVGDDPVTSLSDESPTPSVAPSPSPSAEPEPSPEPSESGECDPDVPETDGCGPEPSSTECAPVADVPGNATGVTTAAVDFDGDGAPDVLRVYQDGGVWHARVEVGGVGLYDAVLTGPGPAMTAIGGATVDGVPVEEAWVKVGSAASTDIIGVLVFQDCVLHRVTLDGAPAEFPIGVTTTAADGLGCYGFDVGIEVFTTTSTDGVTYTGTSTIYTIDYSTSPPSLLAGAVANQTETTSSGASWNMLHTFNCDSLNTIP
jgi:hypothetical protein